MQTSEDIKEIATALTKVQANLQAAKKNSVNPHFRSSYADLASIWEACREQLGKNGIAVVQGPSGDGETLTLTTRLLHTSGQWIQSELAMKPTKKDPQGMGSAITYARRYALAAMVGVAPDDDDDGNAASAPTTLRRAPQQQARPTVEQITVEIAKADRAALTEIAGRISRIYAEGSPERSALLPVWQRRSEELGS